VPPQRANGRHPDGNFATDETLYRRFHPLDIDRDGTLIASQLVDRDFPGLSTNRSRYSVPEDVLHRDCCNRNDCSGWGIARLQVSALNHLFEISGDDPTHGVQYRLLIQHVPLDHCYAHTEITCCREGEDTEQFTRKVKRGFRAQIARCLSVERAPSGAT